jgi:S1-C subfamily serine protease
LFALPAYAQNYQYFQVQSGTGFFVDHQYIVTNAHVVTGCATVIVKGAVPEHEARVVVFDNEHDLALIQTDKPPREFAPLRVNIEQLHVGDRVLVIGYPGQQGAQGEYKVSDAQVDNVAPVMPGSSPGQFYITGGVEHGNSGGPVFDTTGNVIGVVVATTVLTTTDAVTQQKISERKLGVAITLATLKDFLVQHGVYFQWQGSGLMLNDGYITDRAKDYIVNVQCRTPVQAPPVTQEQQP